MRHLDQLLDAEDSRLQEAITVTIAFVQATPKSGASITNLQSDTGFNTTTGSLMVVVYAYNRGFGGSGSCLDNKGNLFTKRYDSFGGTNFRVQVWDCSNANGGTDHKVTVDSGSGLGVDQTLGFLEISGASTASDPSDKQASVDTDNTNPRSSGSTAAATAVDQILIGFGGASDNGSNGSFSNPSSGFTSRVSISSLAWPGLFVATKVVTPASGTYSFDFDFSDGSDCLSGIITYKAAGGGGTGKPAAYYFNMMNN